MSNVIDKEAFLSENIGFVKQVASKYCFDTPKFSFDDLVQIGNQAAIRALDSYDSKKGVKPLTYVGNAIDRDICEFVRSNKYDVYVSNHAQRKAHKIANETGKTKDFNDLVAVRLDWDNPQGEGGGFAEVLPSGAPPPEQQMMVEEQSNILLEEINKLPPIQQKVIKGKYFDNISFVTLGAELGFSKQRAKQIEQKAFETLRTRLGPRLGGFIARSDGLARTNRKHG